MKPFGTFLNLCCTHLSTMNVWFPGPSLPSSHVSRAEQVVWFVFCTTLDISEEQVYHTQIEADVKIEGILFLYKYIKKLLSHHLKEEKKEKK